MNEFKLPDPKDKAGKILGIGLLGGVGLLTYSYILPFLNTIVWGTAQLAAGCIIGGIVLYVLTSRKFWKRAKIVLDALGELSFKWFIEMNPFAILELQLDRSENDREQLKSQCEKLKAQESKLKESLEKEQNLMNLFREKVNLCQQKLKGNPDEETELQLESASTDFINSQDYIEKVTPVYVDIQKLVSFADKAYRKSGYALKNARSTVRKQRETYEAVTVGQTAMSKALRAFSGDNEMNKAANIALDKLRSDIATKVGAIRNSISLTSQIMNERDLEDAAKVSIAARQIQQINLDDTFGSGSPLENSLIQYPSDKNKWIETLKTK